MNPGSLIGLVDDLQAAKGSEGHEELATFESDQGFVERAGPAKKGVIKGFGGVLCDVVGGVGVGTDGPYVDDEGIAGDSVPELLECSVGNE